MPRESLSSSDELVMIFAQFSSLFIYCTKRQISLRGIDIEVVSSGRHVVLKTLSEVPSGCWDSGKRKRERTFVRSSQ